MDMSTQTILHWEKIGEPAFPQEIKFPDGSRTQANGLTVQGWYVGQILSGIFAQPGGIDTRLSNEELAEHVHDLADAMVKEGVRCRLAALDGEKDLTFVG